LSVFPTNQSNRLGQRKLVSAEYQALKPTDWKRFQVKKGSQVSCMQTIGKLLDQVFQDNPKSFRIFSPDELESNKLNEVFKHTGQNFQWINTRMRKAAA
jgi:xylulose-5-phosphate/fructose-6-phosphate phosphoketolase